MAHGADPLGRVGADQADLGATLGAEQVEERLQGLAIMSCRGPHQSAGVVIDDHHQVLVAAPIGDLVDPDPRQPIERIP